MIDIKLLRENPKKIEDASKAKGVILDFNRILILDKEVKILSQEIEQISSQKNEASKRIPQVDSDERAEIIKEMKVIDKKGDALKEKLTPLADELEVLLYQIPNPALADVTVDSDEANNEIIKTIGEKTTFDFVPLDHMAIGEKLGIIDTERAAKASGSRFTYLKGNGAMLQFALLHYALETVQKYGFLPVVPPNMVNARAMRAMGYLEHGGHDEIYYLPKDNLYLVGTAEQSIGPMHMDETFKEEDLPIRYAGYSACYRREAGSYGKDTKGILRVHQFDKIEMFSFANPNKAEAEHELILKIEEELMQGLEIPYHVIKMVTGDLGLPAAKKYDIEAWIPSQNTYRETHSCSTCTDFQARRLNTRFKNKENETKFVYTLNGTAFAIGRTLIAVLENNQNADGSVNIPTVLQKYMGGKEKLEICD